MSGLPVLPESDARVEPRVRQVDQEVDQCEGDRHRESEAEQDRQVALADRVVIMSAGPSARIIGDWRITLPRPRDIAEIRMEKDFHALHREIWGVLKDEVMKGYAQSTQAGAA